MSVPCCTQRDSRLGELLDEEYFLSKVFKYLVDDGLHECSRVCRRWRRLSLRMHPRLARVPWEKMPDAASKFPNATSVTVDTEESKDDLFYYPDILSRFANIQQLSTRHGPAQDQGGSYRELLRHHRDFGWTHPSDSDWKTRAHFSPETTHESTFAQSIVDNVVENPSKQEFEFEKCAQSASRIGTRSEFSFGVRERAAL